MPTVWKIFWKCKCENHFATVIAKIVLQMHCEIPFRNNANKAVLNFQMVNRFTDRVNFLAISDFFRGKSPSRWKTFSIIQPGIWAGTSFPVFRFWKKYILKTARWFDVEIERKWERMDRAIIKVVHDYEDSQSPSINACSTQCWTNPVERAMSLLNDKLILMSVNDKSLLPQCQDCQDAKARKLENSKFKANAAKKQKTKK